MRLLATKGFYHISANEKKIDCKVEHLLVDAATEMMGDLVGENAITEIEPLIAEMLDGDWLDNEVSLGRLLSSGGDIQVQLKITKIKGDFLFSDEEDNEI